MRGEGELKEELKEEWKVGREGETGRCSVYRNDIWREVLYVNNKGGRCVVVYRSNKLW